MHHGTILYDSDLAVVEKALVVPKDKIASKGIKSVQSRVTNVKNHIPADMPVAAFIAALREAMFRENNLIPYTLSAEDLAGVKALQKTVYDTWDWNYGMSPAYSIRKERRVEDCGKLEIHRDVEPGFIKDIAFFGDYFGNADSAALAALLRGRRLEEKELAPLINNAGIGEYFHNLDTGTFLSILLD
jgi:lipoate-protein ligase A